MTRPDQPSATLVRIDEVQARLRRLLRSASANRLAQRPASGDWSALENVRHLLFAEERHLCGLVSVDRSIRALALPSRAAAGEGRMSAAGGGPSGSLEEVLAAWSKLHRAVRAQCVNPSAELERALERNLKHLNAHVKVIEGLLRD